MSRIAWWALVQLILSGAFVCAVAHGHLWTSLAPLVIAAFRKMPEW